MNQDQLYALGYALGETTAGWFWEHNRERRGPLPSYDAALAAAGLHARASAPEKLTQEDLERLGYRIIPQAGVWLWVYDPGGHYGTGSRASGEYHTREEAFTSARRHAASVNSVGRIEATVRAAEPQVPRELAAIVPGSRWLWEPLKPYASAVVEVVDVFKPNGKEWQVQTKRVRRMGEANTGFAKLTWNDASRFIEAAVLLSASPLDFTVDDQERTA
jgi:hypothetical protein